MAPSFLVIRKALSSSEFAWINLPSFKYESELTKILWTEGFLALIFSISSSKKLVSETNNSTEEENSSTEIESEVIFMLFLLDAQDRRVKNTEEKIMSLKLFNPSLPQKLFLTFA